MISRIIKKVFNREFILYGIFGVLTSVENVVLFQLLVHYGIDYKISNFITLVIVKLSAYVLNKNIVFNSHAKNLTGLAKEFLRFLIARGATFLIDWFGLIFMVEVLHLEKLPCKIFLTVLVIILNYIIGKKHVFKDSKNKQGGNYCGR